MVSSEMKEMQEKNKTKQKTALHEHIRHEWTFATVDGTHYADTGQTVNLLM